MKGNVTVLGIDVAKQKVDVALLKEKDKHQAGSFGNTPRGHQKLWQWLKKHKATDCFACLEATGPYGERLAVFLHEKNVKVSVVNPARVKGFRQSELGRTKTDEADAALIARFCRAMKPALWGLTTPRPKSSLGRFLPPHAAPQRARANALRCEAFRATYKNVASVGSSIGKPQCNATTRG